jgi:3',5'-cyclic AMP phosphodiesterase CpdA
VTEPFVIVQISDPHIGGDWAPGDSVGRLSATVDSIRSLQPALGAVLVTGDLADHATDEEYGQVRKLLAPLEAPLYVLPGNHDDRDALHRHFGVPGANGEPVQYVADLGPLRLIALDSTRPGEDPGQLDAERLAWLDDELKNAPTTPTLIALHHSPVITGVAEIDEFALQSEDRRALGTVIERHPQVLRIVGGHVHRSSVAELGGRPVVVAPSTYVQGRFAFGADGMELTDESPGFVVHALLDGDLISTVHSVS